MSTGVNGLSSAVEILTENLILANIHSFKLSRVKLYESDLKGVSSYRGFELPTVNYSKGNPGEIDSGSS